MQHRHGCVIVYNDKEIVAEGYNNMRSVNMENIFSVHAEMDAINKLRQVMRTKSKDFITKCKLYVVRIGTESMDYPLKLSAPCAHCSKIIRDVGIPRVCYSLNEIDFEEEYIPKDPRRQRLAEIARLGRQYEEVM
jgi:deoxycytidylate deaminase